SAATNIWCWCCSTSTTSNRSTTSGGTRRGIWRCSTSASCCSSACASPTFSGAWEGRSSVCCCATLTVLAPPRWWKSCASRLPSNRCTTAASRLRCLPPLAWRPGLWMAVTPPTFTAPPTAVCTAASSAGATSWSAPTCLSSCCWTSSTCVSERRSACRAGRGCWHAGLLAGAGQILDVVQHVMALIDLLRVLRHLHALCIGSGVAVEVVLGLQHAVGDVQQAAAGGYQAAGCARGAGISSQLSILLVLGLRVLCQAAAQRGQRSGAQSDSQASSRDVHQTFPVV